MLTQVVTKNEFMNAFDTYRDTLLRFLADFTNDEGKARRIMETALWDWLGTSEDPNAARFTQLLQITRKRAIEELKITIGNPYIERKFFLISDRITPDEKEIFYLSYHKGFSREEVGTAFNITSEEVKTIVRKVLLDVHSQLR